MFPAELLEVGVAIADDLTKGVQQDVTLEPWLSSDAKGKRTYDTPVTFKAVVNKTRRQRPTGAGTFVNIVATLTVVGDVAPNGAAGRREPIDPRDRITLADGTTGPILSAPSAVMNPNTGRGFINKIEIGEL